MYYRELTIQVDEKSATLRVFEWEGIHYVSAKANTPLKSAWNIPILGKFAQFKANCGMVAEQIVMYLHGLSDVEAEHKERCEQVTSELRSMARMYWQENIEGRPFDKAD